MTDRASAEGLRARIESLIDDDEAAYVSVALIRAALRDTGSRPDSGGDIDALLAEADRRVTALQYDVKNARMRQGIGMGAGIYRDVFARLSTPRTETSETADTVRIGSKTYLAGSDDD